MLPLLVATLGCEGCNSTASSQMNATAATAKRDALEPRLKRLAADDPTKAADVQHVLDTWGTPTEEATYQAVAPLMGRFKELHPDEAADVDLVMRNWQRRLDSFAK